MEQETRTEGQVPYHPGMPDRRQRKADIWSRLLRYLTLLIYPVLILNLFTFLAIANTDQQAAEARKMGTTVQDVSSWISLNAFLPVMAGGLVVSAAGLILNRKRARRHTDYNYQNQWVLVILSVGGIIIYLLLRSYLL